MSVSPELIGALQAATAQLQRGAVGAARAACERALALAPEFPDAWNLLGLTCHRAGDLVGARAAFERATTCNPRYANAWDNLAATCAAMGAAAAAVQAQARALDLRRGDAGEWYNLGVRAHRTGRLALASDCFERALALAPADADALNNLAAVRDQQHRPLEAQALVTRLLALAATPYARYNFAAIFSKATLPADLARGLEQAQLLLQAQPEHAGAHDCAAIILGKLGRGAPALAHAQAAVRLAPENPDYAVTLAHRWAEAGELEHAAQTLAHALERSPDSARAWRELGTVELRRGRPAAATLPLRHALELAPDDQAALAQHAVALFGAGTEAAAHSALGIDRFLRAVQLDVPSGFADAAAFNRQLAQDIRTHSRLRFEPVGLAAKGGYLTEDLLADRTAAIVGFERSLRAALDAYTASLAPDPAHPFLRAIPRAYRLNIWATRVAAQGVIDTHIHDQSWLSGAYYVELPPGLGAGDHAGWIEFGRPPRGLPDLPESAIRRVEPAVGTLLLFPSYLYHRTLPFAGGGERISISFDLAAE